jgi:hypothetical protein
LPPNSAGDAAAGGAAGPGDIQTKLSLPMAEILLLLPGELPKTSMRLLCLLGAVELGFQDNPGFKAIPRCRWSRTSSG